MAQYLALLVLLHAPFCYSNSAKIGIVLTTNEYESHKDVIEYVVSAIPQLLLCDSCAAIHTSILRVEESTDVILLSQRVAEMREAGVQVVIGPSDLRLGRLTRKLCIDNQLFYIKNYWDETNNDKLLLSVHPSHEYTTLLDMLLTHWKWNYFVLLTEKAASISHFERILVRRGTTPIILEYDESLGSMKEMAKAVFVALNSTNTIQFLEASLRLGMISPSNWFILTSLGDLNDGLEAFTHNHVRLTLPILSPPRDFTNTRAFEILQPLFKVWKKKRPDITSNYSFNGLTGPVQITSDGRRNRTHIDIWELGISGKPIKIGSFSSTENEKTLKLVAKELPGTHDYAYARTRERRLLKVTTIEERPYVMEKKKLGGGVEYEGFCVDLLDRLAESLDFEYVLNIVRDAKYGQPRGNSSEWDGMIGEILRGEADMAVAPITVTARRLEVVDFTDPFLQLGISMLMRVPERQATASITSFMSPLSVRVWSLSAIGTLVSALAITVISVLSVHESSRQFTLKNSIWYLLCILLRASSGFNSQCSAARLAAAIWWMFTLVLIAQYTANFAAVLTVERKSMPFNSFEELGNQSEYSFGSIYGGSTMQFFQHSRLDTFKRIWERMEQTLPSAFVQTNDQGVERVLHEKYVFLMESASLEYELTQNCNLTRVGNVVLGSNGYSIALPKGSQFREKLTRQILEFNEKGVMMLLKNHWWKSSTHSEECARSSSPGSGPTGSNSLGLQNTFGLFALLGVGLLVSLLIAIIEKVGLTLDLLRKRSRTTPVPLG